MKMNGPTITLVSGLVVAAVLFGLSTAASNEPAKDRPSNNAAGNAASNAAPSTPPAAQPSASSSAPAAPPAAAVPATYAGPVTGGAATIAISVRDGKAIAYLCNGRNLESWLRGAAADGLLTLSGAKGSLTGSYADGFASGTAVVGGRPYQFRVEAVAPPSGLYRLAGPVAGATVVGGWIKLRSGEVVGMITSNGVESPAPAIDLPSGNVTINGTTVQAAPADPTR